MISNRVKKRGNSVAQEGCLHHLMEEHRLKPLQYALLQLSLHPAAPAWSSHLLHWRKLPQFCTKISPRQKTPSPYPTAVFSSPRTWLSACLRLHIHEVRPQLRRQGSPARACRPHFSISIALHFYSFIPARQICTAPLLIYWGSPLWGKAQALPTLEYSGPKMDYFLFLKL